MVGRRRAPSLRKLVTHCRRCARQPLAREGVHYTNCKIKRSRTTKEIASNLVCQLRITTSRSNSTPGAWARFGSKRLTRPSVTTSALASPRASCLVCTRLKRHKRPRRRSNEDNQNRRTNSATAGHADRQTRTASAESERLQLFPIATTRALALHRRTWKHSAGLTEPRPDGKGSRSCSIPTALISSSSERLSSTFLPRLLPAQRPTPFWRWPLSRPSSSSTSSEA